MTRKATRPRQAKGSKRVAATKPAKPDRGTHPKLALLLERLPPGRHAAGTLIVTKPGAHHAEMRRWLQGNVAGRVALGRSAFGDILIFRDLRKQAAAQGLASADEACDVALIDLNFKKMTVLAWSVEELLSHLDSAKFQRAFLRKKLYDQVKARLGDYGDDEAYAFAPVLALGGRESADSVQRSRWSVYQDFLLQL
jgi:hypothetical protein